MNGLYGYPLSGSMLPAQIALAGAIPAQALATLKNILNGNTAKQLKAARSKEMSLRAQLGAQKNAIDAMPSGPSKTKAYELWQKANSDSLANTKRIQEAANKYNEAAGNIQTYSGGSIKPPLAGLSGLGALGVAPAVLIAYGVVTIGALLALTELLATISGSRQQTQGVIGQIAQTIKEGGGVVKEFAGLTKATAGLLAVVVAGFVVYVVYDEWERRKSRSGGYQTVRATPPPTTIEATARRV